MMDLHQGDIYMEFLLKGSIMVNVYVFMYILPIILIALGIALWGGGYLEDPLF